MVDLVILVGVVLIGCVLAAALVGATVRDPVCRRCGYPVRGWSCRLCPECGNDSAADGVKTRSHAKRFAAAGLALGWATVICFGWEAVGSPILRVLVQPGLLPPRRVVILTQPKSDAFDHVQILFEHNAATPAKLQRVELRLHPMATSVAPHAAPQKRPAATAEWTVGGAWSLPDLNDKFKIVQPAHGLTPQEMLDWWETIGLPINDPVVQDEAMAVASLITVYPKMFAPRQMTRSEFRTTAFTPIGRVDPPWWIHVERAAALLVYAAGVMLLIVGLRRWRSAPAGT